MAEIARLQVRPLLQHHDRVAGGCQFPRHDAPGSAGTDNDKIHLFICRECLSAHLSFPLLRVIGIVIAKGRLCSARPFETDQFPADPVPVTAMRWIAKHAGDG